MIEFNTESYNFMTFDPNRLDHVKAKMALSSDSSVRRFLNDTVDMFLVPDEGYELTNSAFLVSRGNQICGYIALFDYFDHLDMHYAVMKSQRGFKYSLYETTGCSILKETSQKLFEMEPAIDFLKLDISMNNINSARAAISAGYQLYDGTYGMQEYRKYR